MRRITLRIAAQRMGLSIRTLSSLCKRGLIKDAKLVKAGDVSAWLIPPGPDGLPVRISRKPGRVPKRENGNE